MDGYEKFLKQLETLPIKTARTQRHVEVEILKRILTPEEAEIGSHLTGLPETAAAIAVGAPKA